ncbi:uncharacterized protein LOC120656398 [Panicum virgatum]|uniref:uncharacterized protein LOC120656398 n=1 Tax=Panicum virgatum TaxID=38727 RepID=UPI0019D51412|nr:uncharacterized protein LOC120656398 [Panicum virgatum]
MMMDLALYDEGNPIMEWLNNSMSESTPILDEYDDSDDDWSTPSNFVVESLQMDAEEVAAFKQKMQLGKKKKKKKKKKMQLDEDEECIADDYDTDSLEEHGSPVYAESGDSSSNDEDDGDNDLADGSGGTKTGAHVLGGSGVNFGQSTPMRPRSTRKRKPSVKSIYDL